MASQHHYSYDEIHHMDGGVFTLNNVRLREIIAQLLTHVPTDVVDYLMKHCLIITTWQSFDGQYLPSKFIRGKDIILLSEYILDRSKNKRDKTILHEFAHCWLKHVQSPSVESITGEEILSQEEEADELAHKWIKNKLVR